MARELDVYLHRRLIGKLNQDDHGAKTFDYAKEWLNDPDAYPVSHSLPLRQHQFTGKECQAYFAGILPEANSRQMVAKNLGISAKNYFAMLWEIGGDCAGAVTFIPAGQSLSDPNARLHNLTDQEFAAILAELPKRPLLAGDDGVRLSLAGAQNKFALHIANGHISIPLGGVPSTHIVKPAIEHFDGSVFNEAFCMRLAREIGLPTARVDVDNVEGIDYLMVERYDRVTKEDHRLERLHQEDFCQALGVVPEN
jgi:serine/threonine-protein kinase HipA